MNVPTPHYLLFSEVNRSQAPGCWHFTLRSADGAERFEAGDVEPDVQGERLDLLTVVRALESLDQPSRVTLVGCSEYVRRGVEYGLPEWRTNGWRWEFFGQMVPVKNSDLWQRVDHAMRFHEVECSRRRIDGPHLRPGGPNRGTEEGKKVGGVRPAWSGLIECCVQRSADAWRRTTAVLCRGWQRAAQATASQAPCRLSGVTD